MKIIIIAVILIITSCQTIGVKVKDFNPNVDGKGFNVIKFYKFGELNYDSFEYFEIKGNYVMYVTLGNKTNYITGDFEVFYNKDK